MIAQESVSDDKTLAEKRQILLKAKHLLNSPTPPVTFIDFYKMLNVSRESYHSALRVSTKGKLVILKRSLDELYINNYNRNWLTAWNGNMDLQFCCDTYAIVTYICDYYSKHETGVTDVLKQAVKLKAEQGLSVPQMLKVLKSLYLTHRQIGACEATYRLLPNLHLKDSNITTVFLTTGFPENRYQFLKWIDNESPQKNTVEIEGREGTYIWTSTVHEKYSKRPTSVDHFCLAEFVVNYTSEAQEKSVSEVQLLETRRGLPKTLKLKDNAGVMRLREVPCVLRLHDSRKKKENHECIYSECLLYLPWRNESELHRLSAESSLQLYSEHRDIINANKLKIFPFSQENEMIEQCLNSVDPIAFRARLIGDTLDPQGEQLNEDDFDELQNPKFGDRHPGATGGNSATGGNKRVHQIAP